MGLENTSMILVPESSEGIGKMTNRMGLALCPASWPTQKRRVYGVRGGWSSGWWGRERGLKIVSRRSN